MKNSIIFVDDSISVLESLKWIFMDEPFYLFAFDSPLDALSVIESSEIAVVVADQYILKMDVLEFLKNVSEKSPYTKVIIMTGYDGILETFYPIYLNFVYEFVKKPLDYNEIKQAVKIAINHYEINSGNIRQAVYHKQCSQF
jgi:DNA-binding NtrC family response regulator